MFLHFFVLEIMSHIMILFPIQHALSVQQSIIVYFASCAMHGKKIKGPWYIQHTLILLLVHWLEVIAKYHGL